MLLFLLFLHLGSAERVTPLSSFQTSSFEGTQYRQAVFRSKSINFVRGESLLKTSVTSSHWSESLVAAFSIGSSFLWSEDSIPENIYWLIHVKGPITDRWKTDIISLISPNHLVQYIPHNSFVVCGPNTTVFQQLLLSVPGVLMATEYDSSLKVDPELWNISSETDSIILTAFLWNIFNQSLELQSQQLVSSWTTELHQMPPFESIILRSVGPHLIEISCAYTILFECLEWFSRQSEIHWIERTKKHRVFNKYVRYIIQSDSNETVIWNHGLRGEGQIVTIGDTGVDYDSCFFHDPNVPVPIGTVNFEHRKIVSYTNRGDHKDDIAGHGTHVAGSLLGEALHSNSLIESTMSQWNGIAPKAKLAFYDFKKSDSEDLIVPPDLYNEYYRDSQLRAHSTISSNSWGSLEGAFYDVSSSDTDRYAYDYQDFLPVFAAGNYGESGYFTVTSPGLAKNVLSVGATKSSSPSFDSLGQEAGINITHPKKLAGGYQVIPAQFGKPYHSAPLLSDTMIVPVNPFRACDTITNIDALVGKIALVERGDCYFIEKARRIQGTGAAVLLVVSQDQGPPTVMGGDDETVTIPSGMIAKSLGDQILAQSTSVLATTPTRFESPDLNERSMASFSSRGPTADGRLKPDVVTPGQFIVSVRSDGDVTTFNCNNNTDLVSMQGTSMATPFAAGAAALVRQYYIEGNYPGGATNETNGFIPSAALIKATLIAGSVQMGGQVVTLKNGESTYVSVPAAPSIFQGYGRIQLNTILTFAPNPSMDLWIRDRISITTLDLHSYCFRVYNSNRSTTSSDDLPLFRVTLVWTDPPASPSQGVLLINNIDLFVANLDSEEVYLGNNHHYSDENGDHIPWDILNNVEQVSLGSDSLSGKNSTLFSVHIRGTNIPKGPQPYALVINGNFEHLDIKNCVGPILCPNHCGETLGYGTCADEGFCKCQPGRTGSDCSLLSQAMIPIENDPNRYFTISDSVTSSGWKYYHFGIGINDTFPEGLNIALRRTSTLGDPEIYISFNDFPILNSYDYVSRDCEPCGQTSSITIPSSNLQVGLYRIGIYGYCCDNSTYELVVQKPPQEGINWLRLAPYGIILLVVIASIVYGCISLYKKRRIRNAAGFVQLQEVVSPLESVTATPHSIELNAYPTQHYQPLLLTSSTTTNSDIPMTTEPLSIKGEDNGSALARRSAEAAREVATQANSLLGNGAERNESSAS